MQVNEEKLHAFVGQMLGDPGGALSVSLVRMGDRLGLYKALHARGPMTPDELAAKADSERYERQRKRRSIWYWKRGPDRPGGNP